MRKTEIGRPDCVVVGAGPNGLAAAVAIARAGRSVVVLERSQHIGGAVRSAELTRPGFLHDVCSAVYPLGIGSPFLRTLPLSAHGLEWVQPQVPLAHPFDDGTAAVLERSVLATAAGLGGDEGAYRKLFGPLTEAWSAGLDTDLLAPPRFPKHPFAVARFGLKALRPARALAERAFREPRARALFAGNAGHAMLPLEKSPSAAFALVLQTLGHAVGWPFARGGAQKISDALASYLRSLGGQVMTGVEVASLDELPPGAAVLCDLTPRQFLKIAAHRLPPSYRRRLQAWRYGLAAFKVDWALDAPIPWTAADCAHAGTVHLGGTLEEIAASERAAWEGKPWERPFVLLAQPSLFDPTRAPAGKHTAWAYCHVPNGSTFDMLGRIEAQVERFAPGFRERILARSVKTPLDLERENPNLVGGDINGGVADLPQLFLRPSAGFYRTPLKGVFLCSSSTPPGGGVHGMCGYFAAQVALAYLNKQDRRGGRGESV